MSNTVYGNIVDVGTTGYVLTSNGAASAPTFQIAGAASAALPATINVVNKLSSTTYTTADRGALWHNFGAGSTVYTYSLPTAPSIGDTYWAMSYSGSTGALKLQQTNASHQIYFPTFTTTAGATHGITYGGRSGVGVIALSYITTNTWSWVGGYPFDWSAY